VSETEKSFWQALEDFRAQAEHRGLSSLYGDRVGRAALAMIEEFQKKEEDPDD